MGIKRKDKQKLSSVLRSFPADWSEVTKYFPSSVMAGKHFMIGNRYCDHCAAAPD